jgi:single-stranded-DNA-specific exonuclease
MRWTEPASSSTTPLLPNLHPLVARTLLRRGITSSTAAYAFLDPNKYEPTPGSALPGMPQAVSRIADAVRRGEQICVWGDFDVDGQTSTAVLVSALHSLNANSSYYLPVRSRESHGVNITSLQDIIDNGAQLIVTCDTGISSHDAVDYAKSRGVDVIITDHHNLPPQLPKAHAIVTPRMLQPNHPLATLAGVGVAYKLVEELLAHSPSNIQPTDLLDLVAIGLVADVAELTGDTRYLVQRGIEALRKTQRPGLLAMIELAELNQAHLNEEHIGFTIGPRLNALGRLGDANPAVELLITRSPARARVIAAQLENYNAQRRLLTDQVTQAAEAQLRADPSLLTQPAIIIGNPHWPGGVVGIVAARLVERYRKPVIVFSTPPGEPARGSARSISGVPITYAISINKELVINFGGHPMAAGLAVAQENMPAFYRRMQKTVGEILSAVKVEEPTIDLDAWLNLTDINLDLAAAIEPMAPFGSGNTKPVFATRNLGLQKNDLIGRNQEHVKLTVADDAGNTQTVLWWNGKSELLPEGRFDLAYNLRASDWRGTRQVQMEFVDFHPIEGRAVEVREEKIEIVDYRKEPDKVSLLASLPTGTLIWAEAEAKEHVKGVDRFALTPASALAIWTMPPSPEELREALAIVHPRTVYLFAAHPALENPENFTTRLIGLVKYVINHRDGAVTYAELAAATAQSLSSVQCGINYLVMHGNIAIVRQEGNVLWLGPGTTVNDFGGAARLQVETQTRLAETAAYHAHFLRADKDNLLP